MNSEMKTKLAAFLAKDENKALRPRSLLCRAHDYLTTLGYSDDPSVNPNYQDDSEVVSNMVADLYK